LAIDHSYEYRLNIAICDIVEIDEYIISFIDSLEYKSLLLINWYYNNIINSMPIFIEFTRYHVTKRSETIKETDNTIINNITRACLYNYPLIAKYLVNKYKLDFSLDNLSHDIYLPIPEKKSDCDIPNLHIFTRTCGRGYLNVAKWIHKLNPSINLNADDDYAIINSCANDHIEVAQWLYSLKYFDIRYPFIYSCQNGRLNVIQWLCELDAKIYSKLTRDEIIYIFNYPNHLGCTKWLYSIFSQDEALSKLIMPILLSRSCMFGKLDFVLWILEINPDALIDNELLVTIFGNSCVYGHLDIIIFLCNMFKLEKNDIRHIFGSTCKAHEYSVIIWLYMTYQKIIISMFKNTNISFRSIMIACLEKLCINIPNVNAETKTSEIKYTRQSIRDKNVFDGYHQGYQYGHYSYYN
jgi:hypothetical protein